MAVYAVERRGASSAKDRACAGGTPGECTSFGIAPLSGAEPETVGVPNVSKNEQQALSGEPCRDFTFQTLKMLGVVTRESETRSQAGAWHHPATAARRI